MTQAIVFGVFLGVVVGIICSLLLEFWYLERQRWPWQHHPKCPCGACYARRMKQAVERAEYERQERDIHDAVREVQQATRGR